TGQNWGWVTAKHDLTGLGGEPEVRFRIVFGSNSIENMYDGFAFDDIQIYEKPASDVGVTGWLSPVSGCGHTAADSVTIVVTNFGTQPTNDTIPVGYSLDSGLTVTVDTIFGIIPVGGDTIFTFSVPYDLSAPGIYYGGAATLLEGDGDNDNDTLFVEINVIPEISSFPYYEDFESGEGFWESGGINSMWEFGTPASVIINSAASGDSAWTTSLDSIYNNNENSYVESPCFDFSTLTNPVFQFSIWSDAEDSQDGAALQYSTDGGASWFHIGAYLDPDNWYNDNTILGLDFSGNQDGWTAQTGSWVTAKHDISGLGGEPGVRFRIVFGSNGSENLYDGFAFDDINIYEAITDISIIIPPSGDIYGCDFTATDTVMILIENVGEVTIPANDTIFLF
ncbi:unnamed protein product, partial [marine sediment metagenome]